MSQPPTPVSHHLFLGSLQLNLMFPDLLVELLVDGFARNGIDDVLALVDELALDLEGNRDVLHDGSNDVVRRLCSIIMAGNPGAFFQHWFEELSDKFLLANLPDTFRDLPPHIGYEDNILECLVSTELVEHLKVASRNASESVVRNAVDVCLAGWSA